jgi:hypothetical protein
METEGVMEEKLGAGENGSYRAAGSWRLEAGFRQL